MNHSWSADTQFHTPAMAGLMNDKFSCVSTHFVIGTATIVPSTHQNTFFAVFNLAFLLALLACISSPVPARFRGC